MSEGTTQHFIVTDPMSRSYYRGTLDLDWGENIAITRGEIDPTGPLAIRRGSGRRLGDVIWLEWASMFLISKELVDLLRSHGTTGWRTYAVSVETDGGVLDSAYSGVSITGRCGPILWDRAQTVLKPAPSPAGRAISIRKGLVFDQESWDGSDFFCPADKSGFVVVVDRVRQLLEERKVRNVSFVPVESFETIGGESSTQRARTPGAP